MSNIFEKDPEPVFKARPKRILNIRALYAGAAVIAAVVILVLCMTVFFNVSDIEIEGVSLYTQEQIVNVGGITQNMNLVRTDVSLAEQRLKENLVYIDEFIDHYHHSGISGKPEKEGEDEHFYMYESSIDVRVLDDATDTAVGLLPLFCDLDPKMRSDLIGAFREDNTFDYWMLDTVLFSAMSWNQRCRDKVAVMRMKYPYELSEAAREEYARYLCAHADRIARRAIWERDTEVLSFLCENDLISRGGIVKLLDYSISLSASECTALLLECQSRLDWHEDTLLEEL